MSSIAVYVRVSTGSQNLAGQTAAIQSWLDGHGLTAEWYVDKASGKNLERPAFEKLQQAIFDGKVKTVVCYKLDRLSRSLRDGINVLCDWLTKGVRLVAVTQQLDFSGANGKLIASVLFGVSEMEMELRKERQAAGIAAAKKRGAYANCGKHERKPKADVDRAKELQEKGHNVAEIGRILGISRPTVYRYLGS